MDKNNNNSDNHNTGRHNTGKYNTGSRNSGYFNTGDCNSGYNNTGYGNQGHHNVGDCNIGHRNTGDCNIGNDNTGNYNTGNCNIGFFCEDTPSPTFFDKPWSGTWAEAFNLIPRIDFPCNAEWVDSENMTNEEKIANPNYKIIGGMLRTCNMSLSEMFQTEWTKLSPKDRRRFLDLPNFDADKFFRITGVDVRTHKSK